MSAEFKEEPKKVVIVGGGIVGINTAFRVLQAAQQRQKNVHITVMSEHFSPHTTSDVAAGIFKPGASYYVHDEYWFKEAWNWYKSLNRTICPKEHGVTEMPLYVLSTASDKVGKDQFLRENSDSYRDCDQRELNDLFLPKGNYKSGYYTSTFVVTSMVYLPWAMEKLKEAGVSFEQRKIEDSDELINLGNTYDVIVNCTGNGAKNLFPQQSQLTPVRGQVIRVKAPWIKVSIYVDGDTYIIPGLRFVTIGGVRQFGNSSREVDELDKEMIWKRVTNILPNMKKATVLSDAVGLRPTSGSGKIKLEIETFHRRNKTIEVVHHYGHGASGIQLSAGTAVTAADLVMTSLYKNAKL